MMYWSATTIIIGVVLNCNIAYASSTNERVVQRLIHRMPLCERYVDEVQVHMNFPQYYYGAYTHTTRLTEIRADVDDLLYTVAHECGHAVDYGTSMKRRLYFGRGGFVSEYASESAEEDFAETYAHYLFNRRTLVRASRKDRMIKAKYLTVRELITTFDRKGRK